MKVEKIVFFFLFLYAPFSLLVSDETPSQQVSEDLCKRALQRLKEGNMRFRNDDLSLCYDSNTLRRLELSKKQEPFAVILTCSDSRVSPELLFNQGLGDLFVVRVAGNVVGPLELDSIDYAALVLGSCIVVVLGHDHCGAVQAVVTGNTKDTPTLAAMIEPAVQRAKKEPGEFTLQRAIKTNVLMTVEKLKETPVIKDLIRQKKMLVVGAFYDLYTGEVQFFEK